MSDEILHALAREAGLSTAWVDYRGELQSVSAETLRSLLAALDLPAESAASASESLMSLRQRQVSVTFVTVGVGERIPLPEMRGSAQFVLEDGSRVPALVEELAGEAAVIAPATPGYHTLEWSGPPLTVATAPKRCWRVEDVTSEKIWGVAAQLYSLNSGRNQFGDFGDLADLAVNLASAGADLIAISPIHALSTADLGRFSPYGPSTRHFVNPLYIPVLSEMERTDDRHIDWPLAGAQKLAKLRAEFDTFVRAGDGVAQTAFLDFVQSRGIDLLQHARFEALSHQFGPRVEAWPERFQKGDRLSQPALSDIDHREIDFHLYLQWRADQALEAAAVAGRDDGMRIGLVADLAVGLDPAGSFAWSHPDALLRGVNVGAPPDLLNEYGQDWGLTTFSPTALRHAGFAPFIATLRAALRHVGGVRIDHVMGLSRLWLSPRGAGASAGTYLAFPFDDLLRLIRLESHRHRAIVIGEDLGTVPEGFRKTLHNAGIYGMQPLWFSRDEDQAFTPKAGWSPNAVALTSTHDLPTVAGWWSGRDVSWREQLFPPLPETVRSARELDRRALWQAFTTDGVADGSPPPPEDTSPVVDAALSFVAGTNCPIAVATMEDLLGMTEQPNIPGTIDTHPNWRQRLPRGNGLDRADVKRRLHEIARARSRT